MIESGSLLQPGWRETRKTVNGLSLHVVEAGRPVDPLLILLHGFPEFWCAWRRQITPLARAGYHVVVPDMRGYNESDAPQEVAAYALDTLAADVIVLADACGATRFCLVGHDWGAVIGWWATARYPDQIERSVLMDGPHPDVWAHQARRHPTQALRSTYVAFFQLPWLPEATLGGFDFPPTLIFWASDDRFLERHVAEAGLALCDDGRLEIVEDTTHWLHLERPDEINRRIIAFMADGA